MTGEDTSSRNAIEGLPAAYIGWRNSTLGQITDALERELVLDLVGPPDGRRILDVGCGDGSLAIELARHGAHVTGVDASERIIAAARRGAERQGSNASFRLAKAEALPFEDDAFDVVLAVAVLCFVEDTAIAMREMTRVLRPGGKLILGELGRHSSWAAVRHIKGRLGSPVWRSARFRSPSDLTRLAEQANLVNICVTGSIFYPPLGMAARLFGPIDRRIGAWTTLGAAFLERISINLAHSRTI